MSLSIGNSNISIIHKYLSKRGIYVKEKKLHDLLIRHPSFPSLQAINDVFLDLGVQSEIYTKTYRSEYDCPLLVRLNKEKGLLAIVRKVGYRGVYLTLNNGHNIKLPESIFMKIWDRNILKVTNEPSWRERMKHYLPKIGIGLLLLASLFQLIVVCISASKLNIIILAILSLGMFVIIGEKIYSYMRSYDEMNMNLEEICKIKYNAKQLETFTNMNSPVEIDDKFKLIRLGNQTAVNELVLMLDIEDESSAAACRLIGEWLHRNLSFKISLVFINSLNDKREMLVAQTINNEPVLECIPQILEEWYQSKFLRYVNFDKPLQYTEDDLVDLKKRIGEIHACQCYINGYLVKYPYELRDLRYLIE